MKKRFSAILAISLLCGLTLPIQAQDLEEISELAIEELQETSGDSILMHRLFNRATGEHFYTGDESEFKALVAGGWKNEGTAWYAPTISNTPVYRLYNPNTTDHHYTMNGSERNYLISLGWQDEGIGWYSDDQRSVPIYRQYNKNAHCGSHNYTTKDNERRDLVSKYGWQDEGIAWYGVKNSQSEAWKSAYKSYIERKGSTQAYYTLFNMDGDDIPELYIEGPSAADGSKVITYFNNEIRGVHTGRDGIQYIEGENRVLTGFGNMGNYNDYVIAFQNGEYVVLGKGEWGERYDGDPNSYYKWNGTAMSKAEYKRHLYSIFDESRATVTSTYQSDDGWYFYYHLDAKQDNRPRNVLCNYREIFTKISNY